MKENKNRKSESQAIWKSHLIEKREENPNANQVNSPLQTGITENPSMETIRRSLSQINLNNPRRTYHKRFLSKPSLSISRVNSSAYYLAKPRNSRQESTTQTKLKYPRGSRKRNLTKPHTIQHKSTKGTNHFLHSQ